MTSKPGTPIGESSSGWFAVIIYTGFFALAVGIFAYASYLLDAGALEP